MTAARIVNIAGASTFGALGIVALAGALFFGATHQFVMVIICVVMTWTLWAEVRREDRKARNHSQQTINKSCYEA